MAGFQSTLWVRERFHLSAETASLSEEALELAASADRDEERDTLLYIEWLLALDAGDQDIGESIFGLFRPDFQNYLRQVDRDARASRPPTPGKIPPTTWSPAARHRHVRTSRQQR